MRRNRLSEEPKPQDYENRQSWKARPKTAFLIRVLLFVVPIVGGISTTMLLGRAFFRPTWSLPVRLLWIAAMFVVASKVSGKLARLCDRFLPLAALCQLNLRFPKEAPSRMKASLRSGSTSHRARIMEEFRTQGLSKDPQTAAEQVLDLIAILNVHDRKTRGHSEKVRALADVIASEMDMPERDRNRLRWAAILHDMGKITVPAAILNKPGKPTDEEWEILKGHPGAGKDKVSGLESWLGDAINCVWEHHERFDGTGYPNRLTGAQMSVFSRIVAVADSFEVMTAARSYKRPMSYEDARAELVRCSGTHFDPEVVRAMLQVGRRRTQVASGLLSSWVSNLTTDSGRIGNIVRTVSQNASSTSGAAAIAPVAKGLQMAAAPSAEYGTSLFTAVGLKVATVKAVAAKVATGKVVATVASTVALTVPSTQAAIQPTTMPVTSASTTTTTATSPSRLALIDETTTTEPTTSPATTSPVAAPVVATTRAPEPTTTVTTSAAPSPLTTVAPTTVAPTSTTTAETTTTTEAVTTTTALVTTTLPVIAVDIPTTTTTTTTTTTVPPLMNPPTPCGSSGWYMEVFANRHLHGNAVAITDSCPSSPDIDWDRGSPGVLVDPDYFSVRLTADVHFNGGAYDFAIGSDDGIRVWIDQRLVFDEWYTRSISSDTVSIDPSPGVHRIVIEYFEQDRVAEIDFVISPSVSLVVGGSPIVTRSPAPPPVRPAYVIDMVNNAVPAGDADQAIAVHPTTGELYVSSSPNDMVYRLDVLTNAWVPVAGTGTSGFSGDGGPALSASLDNPAGLAFDPLGNLYIADKENHRIRMVNVLGVISTFAGTGVGGSSTGDGGLATAATFTEVRDLDYGGNAVFVNDGGTRIRRISLLGSIRTVLGDGVSDAGVEGELATDFSLRDATDVSWRSNYLAVADRNRIVYSGISSTSRVHVRAGEGSSDDDGEIGLNARVMTPKSVLLLAIPGQPGANANVFYGEFESNLIRGVLEATETVWTIAGVRGANGSAGDGGPATDAKLREITDLALDRISGKIYLLDHGPTPAIRVLR